MIISTDNNQIRKILAGVCLFMPDGSGYNTAPVPTGTLANLCTVLAQEEYTGQWSVAFTEPVTGQPYDALTVDLEPATAQAFMLSPGFIGADSIDLIHFVEEVYGQPVTMQNYQRVAQLFRLWYAANAPDEYHNPPDAPPTKYAELGLLDTANKRNARTRKREAELRAAFAAKGWKNPSAVLTAMKNGKIEIPQNPDAE